jgi:hypothetical protein
MPRSHILSVRNPKSSYETLQKLSRLRTLEEGKPVAMSELCRDAILQMLAKATKPRKHDWDLDARLLGFKELCEEMK